MTSDGHGLGQRVEKRQVEKWKRVHLQHGQHDKSCPSVFRMCALGTCRTRNVTAGRTLPMAPAYVVKVSPRVCAESESHD